MNHLPPWSFLPNDWKILKVETKELTAVAANKRLTEQIGVFEGGMTFCSDVLPTDKRPAAYTYRHNVK